MSLDLPSDLKDFLFQSVVAGKYPSENDVVVAALRRLQEEEAKAAHLEWLRKEIAIGIEASDRGESIEMEEAFRQLAQEFPDLFDESEVEGCP
jgi:antitoxin ParD1/3/4